MESYDALRSFRRSFYECLHRRKDALFELGDAILTAEAVSSPVHLSLQESHRRGWGSFYAALDRGRIDVEALRDLLAGHPLAGGDPPVYAVDVSVWPRCDAECSPLRSFYYHPSRHSAGQPIVACSGPTSSSLNSASFARAGRPQWMSCASIRIGRQKWLPPSRSRPCSAVPRRRAPSPLFVFDAGYDPVKLQRGLEGSAYQILVRLRAGRRFYGDRASRIRSNTSDALVATDRR